ncbi:hypothetical protein RhoFasGS6_04314 [Rhodococcus fascians]|nr:hypothetical protein [Rhodococcus fascians]
MRLLTALGGAVTGGEVAVEDVSEGVGASPCGTAFVWGAVGGRAGFGQRRKRGEQLFSGDRIEIHLRHETSVEGFRGEEFVAVGVYRWWLVAAVGVFEFGDRFADAVGACPGPGCCGDHGFAGDVATLLREVLRWCFGEGENQGGVVDGHDAGVHGVGDVGEVLQPASEGHDLVRFARGEEGGGGEPPCGAGEAELLAAHAGVDVGDESDAPCFEQLDLVGDISSVGEEFAFAQLPGLRCHGDKCIERVFDAQ